MCTQVADVQGNGGSNDAYPEGTRLGLVSGPRGAEQGDKGEVTKARCASRDTRDVSADDMSRVTCHALMSRVVSKMYVNFFASQRHGTPALRGGSPLRRGTGAGVGQTRKRVCDGSLTGYYTRSLRGPCQRFGEAPRPPGRATLFSAGQPLAAGNT